jgi:GIY-YIG catalytic domain/NUMOD1 domain
MILYKKYNNNNILYKEDTRFFSSKVKPLIIYNNSLLNKSNALRDNVDKSGIYRWVNRINNKNYVGSSVNLYRRFINYYYKNYLNKRVLIRSSHIYRALLFYGHDKFNLEILEYCDKKFVIKREQHYIDLFKPEYNILKIAGSTLGFKHSPETLLKYKNRKLSLEGLANLKKAKMGVAPSLLTLLATRHPLSVLNKENNSIKEYVSIRGAAKDIGVSHGTILNHIKNKK